MTNPPNKEDNLFCTLELTKKQAKGLLYIFSAFTILVLGMWVVISEHNIHAKQAQEIEQIKLDLEECRAEATAWYNATTSLSDQIVFAALKGLPAEKVNTNIATEFAVKGHELKCIEPKLPTG